MKESNCLMDLIELVKQDDEMAAREFCKIFERIIRADLRKYQLDSEDEKDVIQNCLVALFKAVKDYNPAIASFKAYSAKIISRTINRSIDNLYKENRMLDHAVDVYQLEDKDALIFIDLVIFTSELERIYSKREIDILYHYVVLNLKAKEVADLFNLSTRQVYYLMAHFQRYIDKFRKK